MSPITPPKRWHPSHLASHLIVMRCLVSSLLFVIISVYIKCHKLSSKLLLWVAYSRQFYQTQQVLLKCCGRCNMVLRIFIFSCLPIWVVVLVNLDPVSGFMLNIKCIPIYIQTYGWKLREKNSLEISLSKTFTYHPKKSKMIII